MPDGTELVIGNDDNGNRSIEGGLGYVALYRVALDAEEVARNALLLLDNDDAPSSGAPSN